MATNQISPLLVIVGETASGKTELAFKLAQQLNGEIISADAQTVRRRIDIGTAKPLDSEQKLVRHHLIDIIEPDEAFNAAKFKVLAEAAITDISKRDKLPIMVGGSGLYIDSVLYNYGFLPYVGKYKRDNLNRLDTVELLKIIDGEKIDRANVDIANKRRLIRLIESGGQKATKKPLRKSTLILGIRLDRNLLNERLAKRLDKMMAEGLKDEVSMLYNKYGWDSEALKGIGYFEWYDYFEGTKSIDEVYKSILKHSQNLAKRQRTWFNKNKSIHWLDYPYKLTDVVELVTTKLNL